MTAKELRSILQAICGSAVEGRTSGYLVHGVQLRPGAEAQAKAAAN